VSQHRTYAEQLAEIRRIAPDGTEYWMARDLQTALGYQRWESFSDVIGRGMVACDTSGVEADNHFRQTTKMMEIGKGAKRAVEDRFLSRYACYLIAMNADGSKPEVAFAQTYFAVQTRRQETLDQLSSTERRFLLRERVRDANKELNAAAKGANVVKYAVFHDAGYRGLYGGLGRAEIQARKRIDPKDELLDCIGHTELAAHYFRITQTQQKLHRNGVRTQTQAIETHREVGRQVRKAMEQIGGTMPEDLPAEPSLKRLKNQKPKGLLDGEA
jgi:DNA-damage-inducible protein D